MSAIGDLPIWAFWLFLNEFVHSNTSESLIFAHFWWVHTRIFSLRPLALKCLHRQSLHEFSLNTDISVCCSGVTFARAPSVPGWWRIKCSYSSIERVNGSSTFPHRCCCNVLGSHNVLHQNKHALAKPCLFYELFINNIADAVFRFKLNRGPSACWTVCGEPYGSFFPWTVPPLIYTLIVFIN